MVSSGLSSPLAAVVSGACHPSTWTLTGLVSSGSRKVALSDSSSPTKTPLGAWLVTIEPLHAVPCSRNKVGTAICGGRGAARIGDRLAHRERHDLGGEHAREALHDGGCERVLVRLVVRGVGMARGEGYDPLEEAVLLNGGVGLVHRLRFDAVEAELDGGAFRLRPVEERVHERGLRGRSGRRQRSVAIERCLEDRVPCALHFEVEVALRVAAREVVDGGERPRA